ncbi:hypothetical protein CXB51_026349 [Gossypium anomalum]|uniref:Uncharacterized protein n=1 Tax=Gossypium anomalum TaxID=47600 RepID=A0A8J5YKQ3_9ROSI|nr:hypothetical protein CXB51_026349 [Gossypium anomalum]
MEKVRVRCGFHNGIDVGVQGTKRRLSIGWKWENEIQLRSYSSNHIDVIIKKKEGMPSWRLIGFCGASKEHNRRETWNLLKRLSNCQILLWMVIGDFKEIMFSFKKRGGRLRSDKNMTRFRETLEECDLNDLDLDEKMLIELEEVNLALNLEADKEELFWE